MTNYRKGRWYPVISGACPGGLVAETEVQWRNSDGDEGETIAGTLRWGGDTPVIAFRVTKPATPKPRECWSYGAHIRDTEAEAIAFRKAVADANPGRGYELGPITKWIEVLP